MVQHVISRDNCLSIGTIIKVFIVLCAWMLQYEIYNFDFLGIEAVRGLHSVQLWYGHFVKVFLMRWDFIYKQVCLH